MNLLGSDRAQRRPVRARTQFDGRSRPSPRTCHNYAGETEQARQVLRALLNGKIELEPLGRGRRRGYRFSGTLTIGRLIAGTARITRTNVVAPTGFSAQTCFRSCHSTDSPYPP